MEPTLAGRSQIDRIVNLHHLIKSAQNYIKSSKDPTYHGPPLKVGKFLALAGLDSCDIDPTSAAGKIVRYAMESLTDGSKPREFDKVMYELLQHNSVPSYRVEHLHRFVLESRVVSPTGSVRCTYSRSSWLPSSSRLQKYYSPEVILTSNSFKCMKCNQKWP